MSIDRTPKEFADYVKRLQALAWHVVGDTEEYEILMETAKRNERTYVEALEMLVLTKSGGAD